jgi:hypothetical protein
MREAVGLPLTNDPHRHQISRRDVYGMPFTASKLRFRLVAAAKKPVFPDLLALPAL